MAKDFWRIESVDSVAKCLWSRILTVWLIAFAPLAKHSPSLPMAPSRVEADETLIRKCADGLYRALVFTPTGRTTLTDNPNANRHSGLA
jgi:hypothetical protein